MSVRPRMWTICLVLLPCAIGCGGSSARFDSVTDKALVEVAIGGDEPLTDAAGAEGEDQLSTPEPEATKPPLDELSALAEAQFAEAEALKERANPETDDMKPVMKAYGAATISYQQLLELYPDEVDSYEVGFNLAQALLFSGEMLTAAEKFRELREIDQPNHHRVNCAGFMVVIFGALARADKKAGELREKPDLIDPRGELGPTEVVRHEMPEFVAKFVEAQTRFAELFPHDLGHSPDYAWEAAGLLLNYGYVDEFFDLLEKNYDTWCNVHKVAGYGMTNSVIWLTKLHRFERAKRMAAKQRERLCSYGERISEASIMLNVEMYDRMIELAEEERAAQDAAKEAAPAPAPELPQDTDVE